MQSVTTLWPARTVSISIASVNVSVMLFKSVFMVLSFVYKCKRKNANKERMRASRSVRTVGRVYNNVHFKQK